MQASKLEGEQLEDLLARAEARAESERAAVGQLRAGMSLVTVSVSAELKDRDSAYVPFKLGAGVRKKGAKWVIYASALYRPHSMKCGPLEPQFVSLSLSQQPQHTSAMHPYTQCCRAIG